MVYFSCIIHIKFYSPNYWQAKVDPANCGDFSQNKNCTLYLSFCRDITGIEGCANSSVCLSDGTTYYRFGHYNKYVNPFSVEGKFLIIHCLVF